MKHTHAFTFLISHKGHKTLWGVSSPLQAQSVELGGFQKYSLKYQNKKYIEEIQFSSQFLKPYDIIRSWRDQVQKDNYTLISFKSLIQNLLCTPQGSAFGLMPDKGKVIRTRSHSYATILIAAYLEYLSRLICTQNK